MLASRLSLTANGLLTGPMNSRQRTHSPKSGSRLYLKRVLAVLAGVPRRLWKTRIFRRGWYLPCQNCQNSFFIIFFIDLYLFYRLFAFGSFGKSSLPKLSQNCQNSAKTAKTQPKLSFTEFWLKPKLSFGKRCADPNRGPSTAFRLAILEDDPLILHKLSKHTIERFRFHRKELSLDLAKRQTVFASLLYILQDFQNKPPMHGVRTVSSN